MTKKCIYCKKNIDEESVIDFCESCGVGVWGEKMFQAIKESMEKARDSGDLNQGSITDTFSVNPRQKGNFSTRKQF